MASEDSDQLISGLSAVHGLDDLRNFDQATRMEMVAHRNQLHTVSKAREILLLRAMHRILPKERDNRFQQIRPPSHGVSVQMLSVIVVPSIDQHLPHSEEGMKLVQASHALGALCDGELV